MMLFNFCLTAATETSLVNSDSHVGILDYVDGHTPAVDTLNDPDQIETDVLANDCSLDEVCLIDHVIDHSDSDFQDEAMVSNERLAVPSQINDGTTNSDDDELIYTHVFSPGPAWQPENNIQESPHDETFASVILQLESEAKSLKHVETLVAVSPNVSREVNGLQDGESLANVNLRIRREIDDFERKLNHVRSGVKCEPADSQNEKEYAANSIVEHESVINSHVKDEFGDLTDEETLKVHRSQGQRGVIDVRSRVKHVVNDVQKGNEPHPQMKLTAGETLEDVKCEPEDLLQEEKPAITKHSRVKLKWTPLRFHQPGCKAENLRETFLPSRSHIKPEIGDFEKGQIVTPQFEYEASEKSLINGKSRIKPNVVRILNDKMFVSRRQIEHKIDDVRIKREGEVVHEKTSVETNVVTCQQVAFELQNNLQQEGTNKIVDHTLVKREVERSQLEESFENVKKAGIKHEVMDVDVEQSIELSRSEIKGEVGDLQAEIEAAKPPKKDELDDLLKETLDRGRSRAVRCELSNVQRRETRASESRSPVVHNEVDLQVSDAEEQQTLVTREVTFETNDDIHVTLKPQNVSPSEGINVASCSTVNGQQRQDNKKSSEQVRPLQTSAPPVQSKSFSPTVEVKVPDFPNAEAHIVARSEQGAAVSDTLPNETITKKRKMGEVGTSNLETKQKSEDGDDMNKRKVAHIKPSMAKTAIRKKPIETKPSKPLTMEEFYSVVIMTFVASRYFQLTT